MTVEEERAPLALSGILVDPRMLEIPALVSERAGAISFLYRRPRRFIATLRVQLVGRASS